MGNSQTCCKCPDENTNPSYFSEADVELDSFMENMRGKVLVVTSIRSIDCVEFKRVSYLILKEAAAVIIVSQTNDEAEQRVMETIRKYAIRTFSCTDVFPVYCDWGNQISVMRSAKTVNNIAKIYGGVDLLISNGDVEDPNSVASTQVFCSAFMSYEFLFSKLIGKSLDLAQERRGQALVLLSNVVCSYPAAPEAAETENDVWDDDEYWEDVVKRFRESLDVTIA